MPLFSPTRGDVSSLLLKWGDVAEAMSQKNETTLPIYIYISPGNGQSVCRSADWLVFIARYGRYYSKLNTLILPTFLGLKLMWQWKTCNIFHGRLCMIYVWQILIWEAMLNFRTQKYQMDNNWIPRAWENPRARCTSWKLVPKLHLVMCWHL